MKKRKYALSAAPQAPKTAPILLTGDICECLKKAAELGYDAIEYHTRENAEFDYGLIRKTMDDCGCRISMIITGRLYTEGGFSLTSNDAENRRYAVKGMKMYVDMASEVGAGIVIGWAKGKISESGSREEYFKKLDEALYELDEYAAYKKVPVMLEVINHYETDAFVTAHETAEYIKSRKFKSIFSHLDVFHMQLEELNYGSAIAENAGLLGYVHLADSTRWYPGSGYINFEEILEALDQIGYEGYLSVECFPHDDNIDTASKALGYMKKLDETMI